MSTKAKIISSVICILSFVGQIVLAPLLTVGGSTPNFMLAFFVAFSICFADTPKVFVGLILGIAFDLTQGGPVGAFCLIFALLSFVVPYFANNLDASNLSASIILSFLLVLASDILNIIIVSFANSQVGFLSLLQSGSVISVLIDSALAILFFIILKPFASQKSSIPVMFN